MKKNHKIALILIGGVAGTFITVALARQGAFGQKTAKAVFDAETQVGKLQNIGKSSTQTAYADAQTGELEDSQNKGDKHTTPLIFSPNQKTVCPPNVGQNLGFITVCGIQEKLKEAREKRLKKFSTNHPELLKAIENIKKVKN